MGGELCSCELSLLGSRALPSRHGVTLKVEEGREVNVWLGTSTISHMSRSSTVCPHEPVIILSWLWQNPLKTTVPTVPSHSDHQPSMHCTMEYHILLGRQPPPPPTSWPMSDTSAHPTLPPNGPSPNPTENPRPHLSPCPNNAVDVDDEDSNPCDTSPCTQSKGSDTYTEEFEHHSMPSEFIPLPEEFRTEPVKVFFPGWRVGEVLSEGIPTMKEYENNLGGSN